MISIRNLHKSFGKLKVLDGIGLEIREPGIYAVLGPNGSGKTTLIKSILGMVIPDSGEIEVNGHSVKDKWKYRDNIDYMPQIANFPGNLTVAELIRMIANLRDREAGTESLIAVFGLSPHMNKKLSHLSGGTRQKVNIVLSLMFDCDLMIMDEPTTGLDPLALVHLKELIRQAQARGKVILITSHIMSFVEEMAGEVIFLLEGRIHYKGTVDALKTKTSQNSLENAIAVLLTDAHV